jgi:hypothetical protein
MILAGAGIIGATKPTRWRGVMRKLKLGAILGFGIGYVMGAKAGRERYEQIQRGFEQMKSSPVVEKALGTAKSISSKGPLGAFSGNGDAVSAKAGGGFGES